MNDKKYIKRKYDVQDYNPHWVDLYTLEVNGLYKVLGDNVTSIEHIGSTSVPGLAGKPTIDILVVVHDITSVEDFITPLQSLGYTYLGQYVMEDSRLFVKEKNNKRLVNLHFFNDGHQHIKEMIGLRDHLRSHPDVVEEYSNLKFELHNKYPDNYAAYRKCKDEWMNALKAKINLT